MKKNDDVKKESGKFSNILKKASDLGAKTVDLGKKAADGIQSGAKALSEKAKNDTYLKRMKKYNPIFPKDYKSKNFHIPNMIMIRDDAERRGIDVCEGAIGWLGTDVGMEVFYLYDEWIKKSGIQFVPAPTCGDVYYVDKFNRNRFIRADCIFSKAHEEKLAELAHIAYSLGAKSCSVEIAESDSEALMQSQQGSSSAKLGGKSVSEKAEKTIQKGNASKRSGRTVSTFSGDREPKIPELKWFANDENIKRLIEMRCSDPTSIQSHTLMLEGASSATMSEKAAYAIDAAISKIGFKGNYAMARKATKEHSSKLIFEVEF